MAVKPRIKLDKKEAKKGDIVEVKALVSHVMETGQRKDASGNTIPRKILNKFTCTVAGKQVLHVRPKYRDYADTEDGTPPSVAQLIVAADRPLPDTPAFWLNWTQFDYLYVLFTEDDAPNPDPSRLKMVADGDRFQLYRILKSSEVVSVE